VSDLQQGLINILDLNDKRSSFENIKTKGVGQTTILKFLGGKGISGWGISESRKLGNL